MGTRSSWSDGGSSKDDVASSESWEKLKSGTRACALHVRTILRDEDLKPVGSQLTCRMRPLVSRRNKNALLRNRLAHKYNRAGAGGSRGGVGEGGRHGRSHGSSRPICQIVLYLGVASCDHLQIESRAIVLDLGVVSCENHVKYRYSRP